VRHKQRRTGDSQSEYVVYAPLLSRTSSGNLGKPEHTQLTDALQRPKSSGVTYPDFSPERAILGCPLSQLEEERAHSNE